MYNTGVAHSCSITQEATCTCVICLCTHICVCMDLPHTSALPGSSSGDSSLPLGVGSSTSPQWGSKRITVIYVFKQASLSLLTPHSYLHPKEINQDLRK